MTLNPRQQRAAERIKALIAEGESVAALERDSAVGKYIQEYKPLNAWLVKVENIVSTVFGTGSPQFRLLSKATEHNVSRSYQVERLVGVLTGALDDLEGGFLIDQEHLIAGEIFDSVLEQARYLAKSGFKDPAAVLARVVVEDTLRRLAREVGLPDAGKAAALNDALKDKERYAKPQWRLVQAWLDVGNSAAHGKFDDYTDQIVLQMIDDIERFLAQEIG